MDPALLELLRAGPPDQEVEAILRLTDPAARIPGVRVVSRFGTIVTCRLPLDRVIETREQDEVASLKATRLLAPEISAVLSDSELRTRPSDIRRPSGLRYTGRGCVVGFLDWGFAFGSASLRHSDGRTRLLALWDQRRDDPRRSNHYGYGTIHDAARLNAALATGDPYRALGYHPAESDASRIGAHGTHTVDTAVGNGRGGGPMGLAPEADIVCVHLGTEARGANPLENLGDSVRVLEGIDFIRRVAGGRPFVVSASIGRHGGPHDGTTLLEKSADFLLAQNPNALSVHSAGNYHSKSIHASRSLKRGETDTLRLLIDPNDRTPNEVEIWYDRGVHLSIRIETPDGEQSRWVPLGQRAELASAGRIVCRIYHRERDPQNDANLIDLFIEPGPPAGEWRLILRADEAPRTGSIFHAWVERDDACGACQARFHPDDADSSVTTSTLANGTRTISVGAVNAHDPARPIAHFSSAGPTRDWRMKPDCVAPGVGVLAARSPWFGESDANALARRSGTSMAAPHVSGCAALLLEAGRGQFGDGELREIILSTVDSPEAGSEPNRYGLGYLNVERAVAAADRVARRRETPAGRSFVHLGNAENQTMTGQQYFNARLLELVDKLVGQVQNVGPDELLRAALQQVAGFGSSPPAREVFRAMRGRGRPVNPGLRDGAMKVIAQPRELFAESIAPGDVIVRRALGEGGPTHVAIVAGPELKRGELAAAGLTPEDDAPGWYVQVVEGGFRPHGINDRFARRVRDSSMFNTADQIVVRLAPFPPPPTHESIDGPSGGENDGCFHRADDSEAGDSDHPSHDQVILRPCRTTEATVEAEDIHGVIRVPADAYPPDGYSQFQVRADLVDSYQAAYRQVKALGGILTSSGGLRDLSAKVTRGRSRTSLHYTARAIDLYIRSGMHTDHDPYLVVRDGGSDDHPLWKLWCVSVSPRPGDPGFDASQIRDGEFECAIWERHTGYRTIRRSARAFCLTDVMVSHGWVRIPSRTDWRENYLSLEWWHFQNESGLVAGQTTFGDELRRIWPEDDLAASGLALDAVWTGTGSFRSVSATAGTSDRERIRWAQTVLNVVAGERLDTDGSAGPRTRDALRRFQGREHLAANGTIDGPTEIALVQRGLEELARASLFGNIGVLDGRTGEEIRRFQGLHSLAADGRVGAPLRSAIMRALARPSAAAAREEAPTISPASTEQVATPPHLSEWEELISFRPPLAVQQGLQGSAWSPNWSVQRIEDAHGDINLDYYPVTVAQLPNIGGQPATAEELLEYIRLKFNSFINTNISRFTPYNASFNAKWRSSTPAGAVIHIDMKALSWVNLDDGSVVASEAAPDHWTFSTIWTPNDLFHPVSGNRRWGFQKTGSGQYTYYTRGADRATGKIDNALSATIFSAADSLWKSLQNGIATFVNANGGAATVATSTSTRYDWPTVKAAYWKPTVRWI